MNNILFVFVWISTTYYPIQSKICNIECMHAEDRLECGLNLKNNTYKLFPNKCSLNAYAKCHAGEVDIVITPIKYCVIRTKELTRRTYDEITCPVFCPSHYRPVCGASKLRSYVYRTFTNKCFMDMVSCRGDDEFTGYVEVPLDLCHRHAMKNIFKEKLVLTHYNDYRDYD